MGRAGRSAAAHNRAGTPPPKRRPGRIRRVGASFPCELPAWPRRSAGTRRGSPLPAPWPSGPSHWEVRALSVFSDRGKYPRARAKECKRAASGAAKKLSHPRSKASYASIAILVFPTDSQPAYPRPRLKITRWVGHTAQIFSARSDGGRERGRHARPGTDSESGCTSD